MDEEETADQQWLEGRSLLVLYASETGKSQEVAEEIGDIAERLRLPTLVAPMNDLSLVSCYGSSVVPSIQGHTVDANKNQYLSKIWLSIL